MNQKEIPDRAIEVVAKHINERNSRPSIIPIITIDGETETPHYFEIIPFDQIDNSKVNFFAIDGSYNSQEFYNGLSIGIYTAGYICYREGKQVRLNDLTDPIILGKGYYPENILITNDEHKDAIYDELMALEPVKKMLEFFGEDETKVFGFGKDLICSSLVKLLSFCQETLEWALVYEISNLPIVQKGDFILRDGTLRSNNIKQEYLVKLSKHIRQKGVYIVAITKNSPIKLELSSTFKKIDSYLQDDYKPKYPFKTKNPRWQKLCCWLEVSDNILITAYPEAGQRKDVQTGKIQSVTKTSMFAKKSLTGGRGFGIFFVARLDYVEKLQNYDWVVADLNIFDVFHGIENNDKKRAIETIKHIFFELTRLTQEHYILGYPFPLVEAHNFVTLKNNFKDEIIKRVKHALYKEQRMDNVDIENLFLDIHERF
ncbi:DNA double-strand break repair nuclease NurA [candidate division TA06 bacterium]|uniref:DNA double-strand break repair nuclease NurA n=1 Tax=candidate division TA06 bacterium TaxID=2250710 RepID=A0A933ID44_UNCT6|nr:DNA double-strand break repair nuclease NurA [candidate division TA06 bacterium]